MIHAKLSASAAHRWVNCPGSVQLVEKLRKEKALPPFRTSKSAAEGTAAHYLLELCLGELINHGIWDISAEEYGEDFILLNARGKDPQLVTKKQAGPPAKNSLVFSINEDMTRAVDVCINHVRGVLESLGASDKGIPEDVHAEIEVDIDVSHLGNTAFGGRLDIRISQEFGELHIIDYKHGVGTPVSPVGNMQLQYYALGSEVMRDHLPERLILTVIQPRCPQVDPVQVWETTPADIERFGRDLIEAAKKVTSKDPPRIPGESQCRWCDASAHCPETQELALDVAKMDFENEIANMPDGKFIQLFQQVETIKTVCKALEARALYELESGKEIPGYKLVRSRTQRKWVEDAEAQLRAKKVPKKCMYTQKLVSFTKLETKYPELVASLVEKPEGKPVVALESDKRPAIKSSVEADFDND